MKDFIKNVLLTIVILTVGVLTCGPDSRTVSFSWRYYPDYGSDDADKLTIYEVSISDTIVIVKTVCDSLPITVSSYSKSMEYDDKVHYFVMTATDTAGNESTPSEVGVLDMQRPVKVAGFTIK